MVEKLEVQILGEGDLPEELNKSVKALDKFGKQLEKTGKTMSLYVTAPLLAAGTATIKFASDLNETLTKSRVVFGKFAADIEQMGDSAASSLGMSKNAAIGAAATEPALARAAGAWATGPLAA